MKTVLFFIASLLGQVANAQIVITVAGSADMPFAAPKPSGSRLAEEVWDTAWADLQMSGYFRMQPADGYLDRSSAIEPDGFDMDNWRLIKTAVLLKTKVYERGSPQCGSSTKVCADAYLYDVATGNTLFSRRFRVQSKNGRALGHSISNEVLLAATGHKGMFGATLAAVKQNGTNKEIHLVGLDGTPMSTVSRNGSINLSPAFSANGSSIAWTSYKRGNPDLYIKHLASGKTRVLSNKDGVNTSPSFSPDGRKVAMARTVGGDTDIFVLDVNTGRDLHRLTKGGGIDVSPSYSADGRQLAWASEASGGSQIYLGSSTGGGGKRISFSGSFNIDPVLSPDGDKVAYVSRLDGHFDIVVCGIDGRNVNRITQNMGDNEDPIWSPDGKYLVFSSTRKGGKNLWLSTADGRHQSQITTSGGWSQPAWYPGSL